MCAEQFLVRVDARAAALECDRMHFRPLQRLCDRVRHGGRIRALKAKQQIADWEFRSPRTLACRVLGDSLP
jgi:hypothetical protein